jgi:5'-nucleotidase
MAGTAAFSKPMSSAAAISKHINTLHAAKSAVTVYHTNDISGNINTVLKNQGGLNLIKAELQKQETSGLLFDAGNFMNGRQDRSHQREVINMMNNMGYHAAAVGSHELLMGQDQLAALAPLMKFALLNCNYEFIGSLKHVVKPFTIITTGRFKIGVTAVGGQINGIKYNDAITSANKIANSLKNDEKCDLVICLSNLGYMRDGDMPDNQKLAAQSENIDLIVGSNTDKLMINSMVLRNKLKNEVILAQTAWHGLMMGRTIINFDNDKQRNGLHTKHIIPGMQPESFTAAFADFELAKPLSV